MNVYIYIYIYIYVCSISPSHMLLDVGVRLGGGGLVSFEQDGGSGEAGGGPRWADTLRLPDLETLGFQGSEEGLPSGNDSHSWEKP